MDEGMASDAEYLNPREQTGAWALARACNMSGIPCGVPVPRLVWHLANLGAHGELAPAERDRCWELARLVLAEASERMRGAADDRSMRVGGGAQR